MRHRSTKKRGCRGGTALQDLAYPHSDVRTVPNPYLAYTGKGGGDFNVSNDHDPSLYPNQGPPIKPNTPSTTWLGSQQGGKPYPDGLVGSSWTADNSHANHYAFNAYPTDVQRSIIYTTGEPMKGGRKGKSRGRSGKSRGRSGKSRGRRGRGSRRRGSIRSRGKRGGALSNLLGEDLINLGRSVQFNAGSAYNVLGGITRPVNPLPWTDHYNK